MTGTVFDISHGCVDDGPGLRTVVFMKGCALDCPWCHNPEGKSFYPVIAFDAQKCLSCGACSKACPRSWPADRPSAWRTGCIACGRCAAVCPPAARRVAGRSYTVDDLAVEASRDADFFAGTGGGVTFSGGEPLAQPAFVLACAAALRSSGVHTAVETSGFFSRALAKKAARAFDLILFDLKHINPEKFLAATGRGIGGVLENLGSLCASATPVEVRIPIVPGFNDAPADLRAIARFLMTLPRTPPVTLLPFHRLAASKEGMFGVAYPYADRKPTGKKKLAAAKAIFLRAGITVTD
jgi:pyruvate formate lyase activating enzyme